MKKCSYCGAKYPDDAVECAIDHTSLDHPLPALIIPGAAIFAWAGLVVGIIGIIRAVLLSYPFFLLHHDIANGAVLWFGFICITAFETFVIGLPCAIVGIVKGRRLIGWLGVVSSVIPAPLGFAMLRIAMVLNGFHITP